MKVKVFDTVEKNGDEYTYKLDFSDNSRVMVFKTKSVSELIRVQNEMSKRIDDFFNRHSNLLRTSDIGFQYKKR